MRRRDSRHVRGEGGARPLPLPEQDLTARTGVAIAGTYSTADSGTWGVGVNLGSNGPWWVRNFGNGGRAAQSHRARCAGEVGAPSRPGR